MELEVKSEVVDIAETEVKNESETGRTNMVELNETTVADAPVKPRANRKEEADRKLFKPKSNPGRGKVGQVKQNILPEYVIHNIPLIKILPNPKDARQTEDSLEEATDFKASIIANGIIEPLIVTANEDGTFMLVAGHRRWKAAKAANLTTVPCIVRSLDENEVMVQGLISNLQRKDLHPVELIRALDLLIQETGKELKEKNESGRALVQSEVARKLGKKVSWVSQYARYRHIPKEVLDELAKKANVTMNNVKDIYEANYKQKEQSKEESELGADSSPTQINNDRIEPALAHQPSLLDRRTHIVPPTYIPSPVFGPPPVIDGEVELAGTDTIDGEVEGVGALTEEQKEGLVKQAKNPPLKLVQNEQHTRYIAIREGEPFAAIYIQWLKQGSGDLGKAILAAELFLQDAYAMKRREAEVNPEPPVELA